MATGLFDHALRTVQDYWEGVAQTPLLGLRLVSFTARAGGEARELDLVELVATVNSSFELTVGSWSA